jgi:hypothetical protein
MIEQKPRRNAAKRSLSAAEPILILSLFHLFLAQEARTARHPERRRREGPAFEVV